MRLTLAALLAVVALAPMATPASACGFFDCANYAVADDAYPMGTPMLDPEVQAMVRARQGFGLSLTGFYNDPAVAMSRVAPPVEPAGYVEAAPEGGPGVVYNPYGWRDRRRYAHSRYGHAHYHVD